MRLAALALAAVLQIPAKPRPPLIQLFQPAPARGAVILRGSSEAPWPPKYAQRTPLAIAIFPDESSASASKTEFALWPNSWRADAPELAQRVEQAERIDLGDVAAPIGLRALYPRHSESRLVATLRERHRVGVPISAEGRAVGLAAAGGLIANAEREKPSRNPRTLGERTVCWGLSLLPWAMATTRADLGGSFESLFDVAFDCHLRLWAHLEPRAALEFELTEGAAHAFGEDPSLIFDLRRARRSPSSILGMRWSVLGEGDAWNVRTRSAELAPGAEYAPESQLDEERRVERALDPDAVLDALARFAQSPVPRGLIVHGNDATLHLWLDADSRLMAHRSKVPSFSNLAVDLVWNVARRRGA